MQLSANDIRSAEFSKSLRGYDADEVRAFLAGAADQVEQLERERAAAEERLRGLRDEVERYRSMDQGLRDTLLAVRSSSEETRESAKREAELLLREAELTSEGLLAEGRAKLRKLLDELEALKIQKRTFVTRMRHLLESQREMLEALAAEGEGSLAGAPAVPAAGEGGAAQEESATEEPADD